MDSAAEPAFSTNDSRKGEECGVAPVLTKRQRLRRKQQKRLAAVIATSELENTEALPELTPSLLQASSDSELKFDAQVQEAVFDQEPQDQEQRSNMTDQMVDLLITHTCFSSERLIHIIYEILESDLEADSALCTDLNEQTRRIRPQLVDFVRDSVKFGHLAVLPSLEYLKQIFEALIRMTAGAILDKPDCAYRLENYVCILVFITMEVQVLFARKFLLEAAYDFWALVDRLLYDQPLDSLRQLVTAELRGVLRAISLQSQPAIVDVLKQMIHELPLALQTMTSSVVDLLSKRFVRLRDTEWMRRKLELNQDPEALAIDIIEVPPIVLSSQLSLIDQSFLRNALKAIKRIEPVKDLVVFRGGGIFQSQEFGSCFKDLRNVHELKNAVCLMIKAQHKRVLALLSNSFRHTIQQQFRTIMDLSEVYMDVKAARDATEYSPDLVIGQVLATANHAIHLFLEEVDSAREATLGLFKNYDHIYRFVRTQIAAVLPANLNSAHLEKFVRRQVMSTYSNTERLNESLRCLFDPMVVRRLFLLMITNHFDVHSIILFAEQIPGFLSGRPIMHHDIALDEPGASQ